MSTDRYIHSDKDINSDEHTTGPTKFDIILRRGIIADVPALLDIYNDEVLHGVATMDLEPRTIAEWMEWFEQHNVDNHPLLVAVVDGHIAGYATLSAYRTKEAYKSTVELSVYIHRSFRRMGIANRLMDAILTEAKQDDRTHLVISVITAGNEGSLRLHERFGFTFCGTTPEVGFKHGEYRDTESYALLV